MSLTLTSHEAQAFPSGLGIFSSHLPPLLTRTKFFSEIRQPPILVVKESLPFPTETYGCRCVKVYVCSRAYKSIAALRDRSRGRKSMLHCRCFELGEYLQGGSWLNAKKKGGHCGCLGSSRQIRKVPSPEFQGCLYSPLPLAPGVCTGFYVA